MSFLSLGLDLSPSATGVVLLAAPEAAAVPQVLVEREIKVKGLAGQARYAAIVTEIMIAIHKWSPGRVVLEGYGLNLKNASSVIPLVELGGLMRFMLHLDGFSWLEPTPSEVKKFVTGSGAAPKDQVMMHVLKRWGHVSLTNNTADAYACAAIGLAHAEQPVGATKEMRAIAGKLKPAGMMAN
jgi:Holliday junction resolvasome RuvABC endonuclease subunit